MFHHKIATHHRHPKGRIFSWIALMTAIAMGMVSPYFTPFFERVLGSASLAALVISIAGATELLSTLLLGGLFARWSRMHVFLLSFLGLGILLILYPFVQSFFGFASLHGGQAFLWIIIVSALILLLRDFVIAEEFDREQGRYYQFSNVGWIAGPLLGGAWAYTYGYDSLFFLASLAFFGIFFFIFYQHFIEKHPHFRHPQKAKHLIDFENVKEYFRNRYRKNAFIAQLGLRFFFTIIWAYVPMILVKEGVEPSFIGFAMAATSLPLVLLEAKVGEWAKRIGLRNGLTGGFLAVAALSLFGSAVISFTLVALVIFLHVGIAFIEPLKDPLFFAGTPKEDEDRFMGTYRLADGIGVLVTPMIGAVFLQFFPLQQIFLLLSVVMLGFAGAIWWGLERE